MVASYEEFLKIDIRAGIIKKAERFTRARNPSYKVWVDFGQDIGILATSAQITHYYHPEDLPGKRVLGVVNLGERNIAGFMSQFLLLGLHDQENHVHLAEYAEGAPLGARLL